MEHNLAGLQKDKYRIDTWSSKEVKADIDASVHYRIIHCSQKVALSHVYLQMHRDEQNACSHVME